MSKVLASGLAALLAVVLLSHAAVVPSAATGGPSAADVVAELRAFWAEVAGMLANSPGLPSVSDPPRPGTSPETAPPQTAPTTTILTQPPPSNGSQQPPGTQEPSPNTFAWAHDPLTVAIEWETGVDPRAATFVQAAIAEWQSLLRSRAQVPQTEPTDEAPFGIRYVQSSHADVIFVLKQQMPGKALGEANVVYADGVLLSARIEMAVSSAEGLPLDRADIQNIAAHEFGHAVGLGHNPDPDDLMYYEYQFVRVGRPLTPSSCDVDTVLAGYQTDGFAAPNDPQDLSVFVCT